MLREYRTQQGLTAVFSQETEWFRYLVQSEDAAPHWSGYPFENRAEQYKTESFMQLVADFRQSIGGSASCYEQLSIEPHP
jgi:hypothetical protein